MSSDKVAVTRPVKLPDDTISAHLLPYMVRGGRMRSDSAGRKGRLTGLFIGPNGSDLNIQGVSKKSVMFRGVHKFKASDTLCFLQFALIG